MIQPSTEFEIMRTLHTLWMDELMTWEQVETLLLKSCQLEITFMIKDKIVAESLEDEPKYEIGGENETN
jgi:hypothetical protein